MKRFCLLILACLVAGFANADNFTVTEKAHPRIILRAGEFDAVHRLVKQDTIALRLHKHIAKRANQLMTQPVSVRKKTGRRLLSISRNVLERVSIWSYMYHFTGEMKYA